MKVPTNKLVGSKMTKSEALRLYGELTISKACKNYEGDNSDRNFFVDLTHNEQIEYIIRAYWSIQSILD